MQYLLPQHGKSLKLPPTADSNAANREPQQLRQRFGLRLPNSSPGGSERVQHGIVNLSLQIAWKGKRITQTRGDSPDQQWLSPPVKPGEG